MKSGVQISGGNVKQFFKDNVRVIISEAVVLYRPINKDDLEKPICYVVHYSDNSTYKTR